MKNKSKFLQKVEHTRQYLDYLEKHYNSVQKAWNIIKKTFKHWEMLQDPKIVKAVEKEIREHDLSKFDPVEFDAYRRRFYPIDGEDKNSPDIDKAFKGHIENPANSHHYEQWPRKSKNKEVDFLHMLSDWYGMELSGHGNNKNYYAKVKDKMNIPDWAREKLEEMIKTFNAKKTANVKRLNKIRVLRSPVARSNYNKQASFGDTGGFMFENSGNFTEGLGNSIGKGVVQSAQDSLSNFQPQLPSLSNPLTQAGLALGVGVPFAVGTSYGLGRSVASIPGGAVKLLISLLRGSKK